MGVLVTIIKAVETRLAALGFTATNEVFDFDSVPSSVIHRAFRIEARPAQVAYHPFNIASIIGDITIWIAYKVHRNKRTVHQTALDDQEMIERDVINDAVIRALASDPLITLGGDVEIGEYQDIYLVSKIPFRADYVRDVSEET